MTEQIALPRPPALSPTRRAMPVPPDPAAALALRQAGEYLMRAGTDAARALFAAGPTSEAAALAALSDELLAAARVCAVLLAQPSVPAGDGGAVAVAGDGGDPGTHWPGHHDQVAIRDVRPMATGLRRRSRR